MKKKNKKLKLNKKKVAKLNEKQLKTLLGGDAAGHCNTDGCISKLVTGCCGDI